MSNEAPPPTILVVDDNPATLYSTSRILTAAGFRVVEAVNGQEAVDRSPGVHLVVLDVNLPDFDGFEVCRRIRANPHTARVPVVHLSATFVKDVDKVHGLDAGADGYLTHPVEPPVLVATVNAFLRARQAEDAMRQSEAKFKAVFDQALHGIALVSSDLIYLDVNPAMCRILGRPCEEIVGKHGSAFMPAGTEDEVRAIARALETDAVWRGEFPLLRSDGQLVYLEWSMSIHSVPGVRLALVTDVTDRKRAEEERAGLLDSERAARADAERANRLKDDFLATLSHELRTPLNAILGYAQILRHGPAQPADVAEAMDVIERNARAQTQLIEDLLDVSRITSGKLRLDVRTVDPAGLIAAALEAVQTAAQAKGIRVTQVLDPHAGPVSGDPARLQQVIWNLVTNAVKFTPKGGKVQVRLARVNSHIEINVSDTGQGIEPEFLPHVFDRFRQADATTTRHTGGLGLGLSIVKHLVELHGGAVSANSPGKDRGATFTVTLPVAVVHGVADPGTPAAAAAAAAGPVTGASARPDTILKGVRILVVDDDPDARSLMNRVLATAGATVATAPDVPHALAAITESPPDLLISDIGMPHQDGYDLIRQVRARGLTARELPAIALTAFARSEDRRRALMAGFQVHVAKPVEPAELTATAASLVGRTGV
jgi:PAS domain S-box-containing protein